MSKERSNIIPFESRTLRERRKRDIVSPFFSKDPVLQRSLTLLGYSFTKAVAEGEVELAKNIMQEAQNLKDRGGS